MPAEKLYKQNNLIQIKIPDNLNIYWKSHKASKHYSAKDLM